MIFIKDKSKLAVTNEVIGLDIAASTVKCVLLKYVKQSYKIENYCLQTFPIAVQSYSNHNCKAFASFIKDMLKSKSILSKKCIASIPNTLAICKWFRVDRSATVDIKFAVSLAMEEHIPFPIDAIYFDYQVFEILDKDYLDVFLVACKKEYLDVLVEIISRASLIPLSVEINSYAIERAYIHLYTKYSNKPSILLNIEKTHLIFLFSDESEKMHTYCEKIIDITDKAQLLEQINCFISTLYLNYPQYIVNNFFLLGCNFLLIKIIQDLKILYNFNIEIIKRSSVLTYSENLNISDLDENFPSLVVSIGLAMKGLMPIVS